MQYDVYFLINLLLQYLQNTHVSSSSYDTHVIAAPNLNFEP
jgi:hypothetical protein